MSQTELPVCIEKIIISYKEEFERFEYEEELSVVETRIKNNLYKHYLDVSQLNYSNPDEVVVYYFQLIQDIIQNSEVLDYEAAEIVEFFNIKKLALSLDVDWIFIKLALADQMAIMIYT